MSESLVRAAEEGGSVVVMVVGRGREGARKGGWRRTGGENGKWVVS